jgi:hypothetical protein
LGEEDIVELADSYDFSEQEQHLLKDKFPGIRQWHYTHFSSSKQDWTAWYNKMACGCAACLTLQYDSCEQAALRTPFEQLELFTVEQLEFEVSRQLAQKGRLLQKWGHVNGTELQAFLRECKAKQQGHATRVKMTGSKSELLQEAQRVLQQQARQAVAQPRLDGRPRRGNRSAGS